MSLKAKKIKSILVSQPPPVNKNNPYTDLAKRLKLKIDFRPFIHIEGENVKSFRLQKINPADFYGVIFTSRIAIDHFFRICKEIRFLVPSTMMYFCVSEAIAFYLQNHITYRKRKISVSKDKVIGLIPLMKKHPDAKFLLPSSNILQPAIPELLKKERIDYTRSILYKTVSSNLSDLENVYYDILVFFSPSGIKSLLENFPAFKQNDTRIAAFGTTTCKAVREAGLRLDIQAPSPKVPSMTRALENYIVVANKK